jgi:hypothetical protein
MRRPITIGAMAVLGAMALLVAMGSSAQGGNGVARGHDLTVRKVVSGSSPSGFVVQVECTVLRNGGPGTWDLPYLANGDPDPAAPVEVTNDWEIIGGAWRRHGGIPEPETCTVTETQNGGASSTTYACAYVPATEPEPLSEARSSAAAFFDIAPAGVPTAGCSAGSGTTPPTVNFVLPEGCVVNAALVGLQEPPECRDQAFVTVTNTFASAAAAAVIAAPQTTG